MNNDWPRPWRKLGRLLRGLRSPLLRVRNQRQAGTCRHEKSWPGKATMQSTKSASMMFLRISPSPDWFDDNEPLGMMKPAVPLGGQVIEEVPNPGIVGVAQRRDAVLPALVIPRRWNRRSIFRTQLTILRQA